MNKNQIPEEGSVSNMNNPRVAIEATNVQQEGKVFVKTAHKDVPPMNPEQVNLNVRSGKKKMTAKEARDARMQAYDQNLMSGGTKTIAKGNITSIQGVMVNAYDKPDYNKVTLFPLTFNSLWST